MHSFPEVSFRGVSYDFGEFFVLDGFFSDYTDMISRDSVHGSARLCRDRVGVHPLMYS